MEELLSKIENYGFQCESGPLFQCKDWMKLKVHIQLISDLKREIAQDKVDAERYRHIRDNAGFNFNNEFDIEKFEVSQKTKFGEASYFYLDKLDEVVDAAIAAKKEVCDATRLRKTT
jgi:hypothetical protein